MQIMAKYSGRCTLCGEDYSVGDIVWWNREDKTCDHIECHRDDESNAASEIKPVQKGVTVKKGPALCPIRVDESTIPPEQRESIVQRVLKETLERITVHGQCKMMSSAMCECAKCQIDRLDKSLIAKLTFEG